MRDGRSRWAFVAVWVGATAAHAQAASDYEAYVERARAEWAVPGVAVGIVREGKVQLLRGFGVRAVGTPEPVDARTLFPIASLTKGFTAAAVQALVAEKRLGWDDRVVERLPGFAVKDADLTRMLTLRDLAAHRSGLGERAEWLWYRTTLDARAVLERLRRLEAGPPFRAAPAYLNTTYLVLGEAAASTAKTSWAELVRTRLFGPLGMKASVTSLAQLGALPNVATPHVGRAPPFLPIAITPVEGVPPAAGIASNAEELIRWMSLFLGRGEVEGRRVLPADAIDELLAPHTPLRFGPVTRRQFPETHFLAYGLGWLLQDYRGRLVVWNTGGLDGVACSLAMIPELGFGVIVLSNYGRTGFPEALVWRAIDDALGPTGKDWSAVKLQLSREARAREQAREEERARGKDPAARPSLALARYAGRYDEPLLGSVLFRLDGARLRVEWNGRPGLAEPWKADEFQIRWDGETGDTQQAAFQVKGGAVRAVRLEEAGEFRRAAR